MTRDGRPASIVTDRRPSSRAAMKVIGHEGGQETRRWRNNRAEHSQQPFRRRAGAMARVRAMAPARRPGLDPHLLQPPTPAQSPRQFHTRPSRRPGRVASTCSLRVLECRCFGASLISLTMPWSDIFTAPGALSAFHVAVVRVPGAVQLMHTSPAALSSFSWPHDTDRLPDQQRMAQAPAMPRKRWLRSSSLGPTCRRRSASVLIWRGSEGCHPPGAGFERSHGPSGRRRSDTPAGSTLEIWLTQCSHVRYCTILT